MRVFHFYLACVFSVFNMDVLIYNLPDHRGYKTPLRDITDTPAISSKHSIVTRALNLDHRTRKLLIEVVHCKVPQLTWVLVTMVVSLALEAWGLADLIGCI